MIITGNITGYSGYDCLVYEILTGLHRHGFPFHFNRQSIAVPSIAPDWLYSKRSDYKGGLHLAINPVCYMPDYNDDTVAFTMWETEKIQHTWVEKLNKLRAVIVPSQWCHDSFTRCGVTVPIIVIPLGFDPQYFYPTDTEPDVCTFSFAGNSNCGGVRKNIPHAIKLFKKAFPIEEDVKLKIKVNPECDVKGKDSRVDIFKGYLSFPALADWYRSVTAFVNTSNAEGFGLHLLEAMACGVPVIGSLYSGVTEYMNADNSFVVPHTLGYAPGGRYVGQWGECKDEDMIEAMRLVYRNRDEARKRGQLASEQVKDFTWDNMAKRLIEALGKLNMIEGQRAYSAWLSIGKKTFDVHTLAMKTFVKALRVDLPDRETEYLSEVHMSQHLPKSAFTLFLYFKDREAVETVSDSQGEFAVFRVRLKGGLSITCKVRIVSQRVSGSMIEAKCAITDIEDMYCLPHLQNSITDRQISV